MKIQTTTTVIECSAEELRQSNTLSDSFTNLLRNAFNGSFFPYDISDDETEDETENEKHNKQ